MAEKKTKTHEVLARKYRPQKFSDVVAQQHVTQTLSNAIQSGRIAQAYLFVGPRGVGKTTLARIYAKALNCEKGPTPDPCDNCAICQSISEGRCLDVMEFDAASNTQVDRVREIILDHIGFAPAQTRYKVFIIDEVHMLSASSFNALLKTLEEPPPHVRFVFATTEPQKIPATILSRCQRFDLRRIPTAAIVATLDKIAKLEKVKLEGDAALAIARGAEGGLRDAESALDQLIAFCGNNITEADVLSVFGLVAWHSVQEMATALLRGDVATLFRHIAEMDDGGKDLQRLSVELLEYFRDLLVVAYAGGLGSDVSDNEARLSVLREQAAIASTERLGRIADILVDVQGQLRYALSRRTLLEVSLARASRAATAVLLDDVVAALAEAPEEGRSDSESSPRAPLVSPAAQPNPVSAPAQTPSPRAEEPPPVPRRSRTIAAPADPAAELAALHANWSGVVEKAGEVNPLMRSSLKDATPVGVDDDSVTLSFDPEFASSLEKLNVPRSIRLLQKLVEEILRRPVSLNLVVGAPRPDAEILNPTDSKPAGKHPDSSEAGKRDWRKEDAVRRAMDAFNGDIIDVRE
ncbi:MAG: DNA polymerase III subunit gamma/tau [Kiritimatiellae bacterium]|nr:DNA polymerase III subunit gamma/tau [Kiritimatiellia bacterium]